MQQKLRDKALKQRDSLTCSTSFIVVPLALHNRVSAFLVQVRLSTPIPIDYQSHFGNWVSPPQSLDLEFEIPKQLDYYQ